MENNQLDDFLRKKLDNDTGATIDDWNHMRKRVSTVNFFKFGLYHYNIYYTLAIVAGLAGIMGAVFGLGQGLNPHLNPKNQIAANNNAFAPNTNTNKQLHQNEIKNYIEYNEGALTNNANNYGTSTGLNRNNQIQKNNKQLVNTTTGPQNVLFTENNTERPLNNLIPVDHLACNEINNTLAETLAAINNPNTENKAAPRATPLVQKRWSIEIYSYPVFSDNIELSQAAGPNAGEQIKTKFAYGANLVLELNNLSFVAGIQYYFFNKNYANNYLMIETIQEKSYKTYSKTIYSLTTGKEIRTITDSVLVSRQKTVNTEIKVNNLNSYKYLELPIMAGYNLRYNKYGFIARAGFVLSLYKNANGIINYENNTVELENVTFIKPLFTINTSVGAYYQINPQLSLIIEPYTKFTIINKNDNDLFIKTSRFAYGLKTGLGYRF